MRTTCTPLCTPGVPVVGVAEECQIVLVHVLCDMETVGLNDLLVLGQFVLEQKKQNDHYDRI